jgi:hypothetical protein
MIISNGYKIVVSTVDDNWKGVNILHNIYPIEADYSLMNKFRKPQNSVVANRKALFRLHFRLKYSIFDGAPVVAL